MNGHRVSYVRSSNVIRLAPRREMLSFLRSDNDPAALQARATPQIEAFVRSVAAGERREGPVGASR